MANHNPYFDFLRGLAILMVVGIHTYPGDHELSGSFTDKIQLLLINFFNCAVPLFLAISGFFIARKKLDTWSDRIRFWKKQIPTVYLPCLVFSMPWLVISCISAYLNGQGGYLLKIINYFLCGYSVYYFIALIIQCYILAPILIRYNNATALIIVIVLSLMSRFIMDYIRYTQDVQLPFIVQGSFPILLLFFYMGIFLSRHSRDYSIGLPAIMMIVGLSLGFMEMEYIRSISNQPGVGQKITLYLFDAGFILLCMSKKVESAYRDNILTRRILFVGEISFGIYFTHVYLIFIGDKFLPHLRDHWLPLWLFSLLLTILIIVVIKKISPDFSKKYLGYR